MKPDWKGKREKKGETKKAESSIHPRSRCVSLRPSGADAPPPGDESTFPRSGVRVSATSVSAPRAAVGLEAADSTDIDNDDDCVESIGDDDDDNDDGDGDGDGRGGVGDLVLSDMVSDEPSAGDDGADAFEGESKPPAPRRLTGFRRKRRVIKSTASSGSTSGHLPCIARPTKRDRELELGFDVEKL